MTKKNNEKTTKDTSVENKKTTSFSVSNIFKYITDGFFEVLNSFVYVFVLAYKGLRYLLLPLQKAFNRSSRSVDNVYQKTKFAANKFKKDIGVAPKETVVTPDGKEVTVEENPSFLAKLWKKLNGDIIGGDHVSKRQMAKLEEKKRLLLEELNSPDAKKSTEAKVYVYKAKASNGHWYTGRFIGFSKMDVNSFLLNEGYDVYTIENNKWVDFLYGESKYSSHRMKNKDLIFWLTQLSTYIKSGIPLTDAVKILMNQTGKDKTKRGIYQSIAYQLTMGEPFSSALAKQGSVFPPLLINMLKAAEATGELEETLDDMVDYYTEIETNRKEMINAITYPLIVLIFATVVITFILLYVIPQFVKIYDGLDVEITGLTAFLLNLSAFLKEYIWIIILLTILIIIVIVYIYKNLLKMRRGMQTIAMRIPVFGDIIIYSEMTVFSKTFSSLLKNNVNITESIDILSKVTGNELYRDIMINTINNISKGEKISEAFKDRWEVPDLAYHMIVTGESTGQLAEMMNRVAHFYQEQHHTLVANLKQFIEPIMIITLAVVVGGIILAVIIPMFDMYGQISMG